MKNNKMKKNRTVAVHRIALQVECGCRDGSPSELYLPTESIIPIHMCKESARDYDFFFGHHRRFKTVRVLAVKKIVKEITKKFWQEIDKLPIAYCEQLKCCTGDDHN